MHVKGTIPLRAVKGIVKLLVYTRPSGTYWSFDDIHETEKAITPMLPLT